MTDNAKIFILIAYLARKLNLTADDLGSVLVNSKEYKASAEFWNEAVNLSITKIKNVRKKIEGK